ncbi:MAG: succinate dehydrogenase, hydrophobic membrane anchor protein [Gammaproteobacteria bacterium]|nr:succinate dehydrogenase, hydrophobic membrane anchor protein [Gammaproteobacteria bacterium]
MSLRTALGRVKGLGSAKAGLAHWQSQRLSALCLIPLSLWFVYALMGIVNQPFADVVTWIRTPYVTVLLIALVLALLRHLQLGLQVVLEDYVHSPILQIASQVLLRGGAGIGALIAIFSILKIALA